MKKINQDELLVKSNKRYSLGLSSEDTLLLIQKLSITCRR